MKNTEYDIPDVTVIDDFTIVYKSQEKREGNFYDSIEEIKTSKDQFLRKLRFFKSRSNEINHMKSILIEENYPLQIFKEFISTLTTNKISLNENNYLTLLQLCEKYQYPELQKQILRYSSSRPDIEEAVEEVLQDDEIDYLKEEVIATHLDICLKNENMLKYPIHTLIRILNSPKRVLKDHKLLFEFVKKFVSKQESKANEEQSRNEDNEEENLQLLMSSLDYSRMSTDELKELFNSKHFSCLFNCSGTVDQMTRFMNEIESQKEQINELVAQIKKQDELFQKYQEENLKNQEILASFESKMMKFEAAMNEKYREEQEKNKQSHEKQLETIKQLEEKNELQEKRIKELEDIIRIIKENSMTCEIKASTQQDQTIKGVININECWSKLDKSRSKYLLSTDESPTLGGKSYEEGSQIEHLRQ